METKLTNLSRRYQAALLRHLKQEPRVGLRSADGLGRQALAKIHEEALTALVSPSYPLGTRDGMIKRAQETGS
jgi:hypothetical protein